MEQDAKKRQPIILDTSDNKDIVFRVGFVKEAQSVGVSFASLEMLIYERLRFYEVEGKIKLGYSVAGYSEYADAFGVDEKTVQNVFSKLAAKGLVAHVYCDKRVYRNKTKLWVSTARLSESITSKQAIDAIKIIGRGKKPEYMIGENWAIQPTNSSSKEVVSSSKEVVSSSKEVVSSSKEVVSSSKEVGGIEKRPLMEKGLNKDLERELERNKYIVSNDTKPKRKVFVKPTVEEIKAYCLERNNQIDAERFFDYYEANGWKVGRNPMKNWRASVRTWERNNYSNGNAYQPNNSQALVEQVATTPEIKAMFDFWKQWVGVSCPKDNENVKACKELLEDAGEDGAKRLVMGLRFRGKHGYLPATITNIVDFVSLNRNKVAMQTFCDKHWEYWQQLLKAAQQGKNVWEIY